MDAAVCVRGVVKNYQAGRATRPVLNGADLEVAAGEFVAITGRSGSGKSTLLHLVGGLDRPESGSISIAGHRLDQLSERGLTRVRRYQIGFVFQFFHLLPELTGEQNVLLPARLAGDGQAARPRAIELLQRLGVGSIADQLPGAMSGGEQQRIAIARALIQTPAVVLADEPTGNLDQGAGSDVLRLLRDAANDGRAVIVVTHDREATRLADRVVALRDGRLVRA